MQLYGDSPHTSCFYIFQRKIEVGECYDTTKIRYNVIKHQKLLLK